MEIRQVADWLAGKKAEGLFAKMGKTWGYLLSNPQLLWRVLLRMDNLTIKGVFYLASRCKRARDTLSEIPETRSTIDFFLRNGILANLFSRANHLTTQGLQQELVHRVYRLTPYIFSSWDRTRKDVIHIAIGVVNNAFGDMYAQWRKKPSWE